MLRYLNICLDI